MKKLLFMLISVFTIFSLVGCGKSEPQPPTDGKLSVSASFNAMAEFVKVVGGEKVAVTTIVPDGTEPHDFELKVDDIKRLSKAKVFVYNGFGMEHWSQQAVDAAKNKDLVVVEAAKGVEPIALNGKKEGALDPHVWLSPKAAIVEVQNIKDALVKADPVNKAIYEKNCEDYVSKLKVLNEKYGKEYAKAVNKSFVTGHAAFGYFCRDFGLQQNSVQDVFAEGEPSAAQLGKLVEYCREHKVKVIFAEELASSKVSETLAKEVGAKVETIYTMEGAEDNKTYLQRMESNLQKVAASL